jgi:hypothetical protein
VKTKAQRAINGQRGVVQVFKTLPNVGNAKYECVSKLFDGEVSKIHKIEENLKFAKWHWSGVRALVKKFLRGLLKSSLNIPIPSQLATTIDVGNIQSCLWLGGCSFCGLSFELVWVGKFLHLPNTCITHGVQ